MPEILTAASTASRVEELLTSASRRVVLISPYVQASTTLLQRLKECDRRGVEISVICRRKELKGEERDALEAIRRVKLRYLENLHAKCYFNESSFVLTSMNLYEYSEKNNREMGVLLTEASDPQAYRDAVREAEAIIEASERGTRAASAVAWLSSAVRRVRSDDGAPPRTRTRRSGSKPKSCCIRCGEKRRFGPNAPLCADCYGVWAHFEDPEYVERYCHRCGKDWESSMARPLCKKCFREVGYS